MKDWKSTKWVFEDGRSLSILEVLKMSEYVPVVDMEVEEVADIRTSTFIDQSRLDNADTTYPIIIVNYEERYWILDGHHRLQKAINEKHRTIKVKILRGINDQR